MNALAEGFLSSVKINTAVFSFKNVRVLPPLLFGLMTKSFTLWWESQIPLTHSWSEEEQSVQAGATAHCARAEWGSLHTRQKPPYLLFF